MTEQPSRPFAGEAAIAADAAIDRAVREIMSAEPRPGLRQRVLARLDEEPRTDMWSWARLGLVAGAAAIVLLAIWARTDRTVAPAGTAPQQAASQPQAGPAKPPPQRRRSRAPQPPWRRMRRAGRSSSRSGPRIVRNAPAAPTDRRVSAASVNPAEETQEPGARAGAAADRSDD